MSAEKHASTNDPGSFSCEVCTHAGEWQGSLGGEIDLSAVPELDAVLRLAHADANTVWIDLHEVSFMDSAGISTLVRTQQRASERDNELFVLRPSAVARRLLNLCGLDRRVAIAEQRPHWPSDSCRRHAIIATDLQGEVVYWNRDAELLYGHCAEEALGRQITNLTVAAPEEQQADSIMQTIREQGRWQGPFEVTRADASTFRAWVRDILVLDDRGEPCGVLGLSVPLAELAPLAAA